VKITSLAKGAKDPEPSEGGREPAEDQAE